MMKAFLAYVARRVALVATVLAIGLLGWPGDVGAQSMIQVGNIDQSGARRIRIQPKEQTDAVEEQPAAEADVRRLQLGGGGFGKKVAARSDVVSAPQAAEPVIDVDKLAAQIRTEAAKTEMAEKRDPNTVPEVSDSVSIPPAEALIAEFAAPERTRTPFEISYEALATAQ